MTTGVPRPAAATPARGSRFRGLGVRASLAVNAVVLSAMAVFIAADAARDSGEHVRERAAALDETAATVHLAVARPDGTPDDVQRFIDGVCRRTSDTDLPGHHLLVDRGGRTYQATPHARGSDEYADAIRAAAGTPSRQGERGGSAFLVGSFDADGTAVYVSAELDDVRREVAGRVIVRAVVLGVFAVGLAVVVSLLLHRLVSRPLRRLTRTIDGLRAGRLGEQAAPTGAAELDTLVVAVNDMSRALADDADRRTRTLAQARRVQEKLLPADGEVRAGVRVASAHRPAESVAGDYHDVLPLADGTVVVCVADVVGHGVPSAMVAAMLKAVLLDAVEVDSDPPTVLRRVNARFAAVVPSDYLASMLVARWCPAREELWHASAGHETCLLRTPTAGWVELEATGTLIGVDPEQTWDGVRTPAPRGSLFVGLTDGVTEAMDPAGRQFGRERLAEIVTTAGSVSASELVRRIDSAVTAHRGTATATDDVTVLAVSFGVEEWSEQQWVC